MWSTEKHLKWYEFICKAVYLLMNLLHMYLHLLTFHPVIQGLTLAGKHSGVSVSSRSDLSHACTSFCQLSRLGYRRSSG